MGKRSEPTKRKIRKAKGRRRKKRGPTVPPGDCEVWPQQYRGKRWKSVYGVLFAGKCQLCAYSSALPGSRQLLDKWQGNSRKLLCTNHPDSPGLLREVLPIETCRNFKMKFWQTPAARRRKEPAAPRFDESDPSIRRIPLGHGLFAVVDAEDYEWLSQYKWHANRRGRKVYALAMKNGRVVTMHRLIMRPRKGCVVDHIDGNGLNNRRCNLRVCTRRQNAANMGPRGGASEFVGVYRQRDKRGAQIVWRGKKYKLGSYDTDVEAAKARDRKAFELHGEYAYLNFPEDFADR
ncbi:MAG: HNH endonuclease [Sedimentisphaerales bacterium]|nr:HNH endonuclease [Sedimentisphaerales bacterium]